MTTFKKYLPQQRNKNAPSGHFYLESKAQRAESNELSANGGQVLFTGLLRFTCNDKRARKIVSLYVSVATRLRLQGT